ncbi:MAG: hypothetical protein RL105_1802 [Verrucomicrobiota bacterium]|jgi:hypothetical protein
MDAHLLKAALACVDVAMAAVSWLILLCTYPDFARWRKEGFAEAHEQYARRVGWVVGPLLVLQMAGHLVAATQGFWFGLMLVVLSWMVTAFWSVPCHRSLSAEGPDSSALSGLVRSHSWRTAIWSLLALVSLRRLVG